MVANGRSAARTKRGPPREQIHVATSDEWRALVDRAARYYLNMSGEEFACAWERGDFENADRPEVLRVALLLPIDR